MPIGDHCDVTHRLHQRVQARMGVAIAFSRSWSSRSAWSRFEATLTPAR
ncbi:MAG: hypothetical protein ACRDTH_23110 [Pseudonocardiaceae bacterium]